MKHPFIVNKRGGGNFAVVQWVGWTLMGIDYTYCTWCLMIATSKGGDSSASGGAGRD